MPVTNLWLFDALLLIGSCAIVDLTPIVCSRVCFRLTTRHWRSGYSDLLCWTSLIFEYGGGIDMAVQWKQWRHPWQRRSGWFRLGFCLWASHLAASGFLMFRNSVFLPLERHCFICMVFRSIFYVTGNSVAVEYSLKARLVFAIQSTGGKCPPCAKL